MIRNTALAIAIAAALLACRPSEPPRPDGEASASATTHPATTHPAAPADASASSTAAEDPAASGVGEPGPAATGPIPIPITTAVAIVGETAAPIAFDELVSVDPAARFQVEVAVPLIDARLALVDSGDAMIPASESHEIGATWSRFTVVPDAPLRPGSTYSLRLDGAADREAHDGDGRSYQITTWELRTTGEPPPPEPKPKAKRRR